MLFEFAVIRLYSAQIHVISELILWRGDCNKTIDVNCP